MPLRPIPDDFVAAARDLTMGKLAQKYRASMYTVRRWHRSLNLPVHTVPRAPLPEDFALLAPTMSQRALARHYGRDMKLIRRWEKEIGLERAPVAVATPKPPKSSKPKLPYARSHRNALADHVSRDVSLEGSAADYLRRIAATYRCNAQGRMDPKGSHWRHGAIILTGAELVDRARTKGFEPDAWERIAA